MFNVEPQESWTKTEAAEFEEHAAARLKTTMISAVWSGGLLLITICCVLPFLAGHQLHAYWEGIGKYLLMIAMALWLWFIYKALLVWASWQSSREIRRECGEPL